MGDLMENNEWQPIETAPKDGTAFLSCQFYNGEWHIWQCRYLDEIGWSLVSDVWDMHPTLWMPLPAPPTHPPHEKQKGDSDE